MDARCVLNLTSTTPLPQVLSCHRRLGSPLPARDAARLSRLMAATFYPTSLDLHDAVLAALADIRMHSSSCRSNVGEGGEQQSQEGPASAPHQPDLATESPALLTQGAAAPASATGVAPPIEANEGGRVASIWHDVWREHGVLPGVTATLERLRNLEALGTVSNLPPDSVPIGSPQRHCSCIMCAKGRRSQVRVCDLQALGRSCVETVL